MCSYKVGTQLTVLINQVSVFQRCPLGGSTVYLMT